MSFIIKDSNVTINTKLTTIGRLQLSIGNLNFSTIEVGDSEIDYNYINKYDLENDSTFSFNILRPKDINSIIKNPIPINSGFIETKSPITNISPIEKYITNTADVRGFFTGSTLKSNLIKYSSAVTINTLTAQTNTLDLISYTANTGDYILFDINNKNTTQNQQYTFTSATPSYWYKVISKTGTSVTLDRNLPVLSGNTNKSYFYVFNSGNSINNFYGNSSPIQYWDELTLTFDSNTNVSNDDVKVWNFNIVYSDSLLGLSGYTDNYYNSQNYLSLKRYINDFYNTSNNIYRNALGIVHYTNNSISNYYGEGFDKATLKLTIPNVLYHNAASTDLTGITTGLILTTENVKRTILDSVNSAFTLTYYNLIDSELNVVGKVFNDLKVIVIEDQEIITALSYKSNRNYTLPNFNSVSTVPTTSNNFVITASTTQPKDVYVTYQLINTGTTANYIDSYGYLNGIPCQYINKISGVTQNRDIQFSFLSGDFPFLSKSTDILNNGLGVPFNRFKLLVQVVNQGEEIVNTNWKEIDLTSQVLDTTNLIIPTSIGDKLITLNGNTFVSNSTSFSMNTLLNIPSNEENILLKNNYLGLGEECFFFGNIEVDINAIAFETSFNNVLSFNQYNTSNNPTWVNTLPVYISEVGIYDSENNLVAIGKLKNPIEKKNGKLIILSLSLDF
jgi:hypothetical protein